MQLVITRLVHVFYRKYSLSQDQEVIKFEDFVKIMMEKEGTYDDEQDLEACLQQCDRIAPSEAKKLLGALEDRLLDKVDAKLDRQRDAQHLLGLVERVRAHQESISSGGAAA